LVKWHLTAINIHLPTEDSRQATATSPSSSHTTLLMGQPMTSPSKCPTMTLMDQAIEKLNKNFIPILLRLQTSQCVAARFIAPEDVIATWHLHRCVLTKVGAHSCVAARFIALEGMLCSTQSAINRAATHGSSAHFLSSTTKMYGYTPIIHGRTS
jgi:hypothetical protein